MALITLDQAKGQIQITHDQDDTKIAEKLNEASAIVLDYLKKPGNCWQDNSGRPRSVPYLIQSAVKLVTAALYENADGNENAPQPLSQAVKDILARHRDPALA